MKEDEKRTLPILLLTYAFMSLVVIMCVQHEQIKELEEENEILYQTNEIYQNKLRELGYGNPVSVNTTTVTYPDISYEECLNATEGE